MPFTDAFPKFFVFPEEEEEFDDEEEDEDDADWEDDEEDDDVDEEVESHSYLVMMSGSRVPLAKPRKQKVVKVCRKLL